MNYKPIEIESLGQLRDEVKLQAHLLKTDMKDELHKLENDWRRLITPSKRVARKSAAEVKTATQQLLKTIQTGYERIKQSLPS